jgi:phytol kinase
MKRRWELATGYSRKIFHLLTFVSATALQLGGGLAHVCLFGGMTTLVLAYTLRCGAGHPFYEAIARPADAPYRSYHVVVSYVATLLGGLLSNLVAGPFALCGYLVCGLGDAAGEPVGTRWGRHWYAVPARAGTSARRSLEGSAGVFVVSSLALLVGIAALVGGAQIAGVWHVVLAIAALCTFVEALTPHGWDNVTLQVAPSLLVALLLGPH